MSTETVNEEAAASRKCLVSHPDSYGIDGLNIPAQDPSSTPPVIAVNTSANTSRNTGMWSRESFSTFILSAQLARPQTIKTRRFHRFMLHDVKGCRPERLFFDTENRIKLYSGGI